MNEHSEATGITDGSLTPLQETGIWAGIWGGLIGTLLAADRLFASWPQLHLEPYRSSPSEAQTFLTLRIINPGKAPIAFGRVTFLRGKGKFGFYDGPTGAVAPVVKWMDARESGRFYLFLGSKSERELMVSWSDKSADLLMIFWWRRQSVWLPRMPKLLRLNHERAREIMEGIPL